MSHLCPGVFSHCAPSPLGQFVLFVRTSDVKRNTDETAVGGNFGFSIFPKDTSAFGVEEPGFRTQVLVSG